MIKRISVAAMLLTFCMALSGCDGSSQEKSVDTAASSSESAAETSAETAATAETTSAPDASSAAQPVGNRSVISADAFAKLLEKYGQKPVCENVDWGSLFGSERNLNAYGVECKITGDCNCTIGYYTEMTPQFAEKASDMEYFDLMGDDTETKDCSKHFKVEKEYPDKKLNTVHEMFKYYDGNTMISINVKGLSSDYPSWIGDFAAEAGIW